MRKSDELDKAQRKAIMRIINEKKVALFGDLGTGKTTICLYAACRLLKTRQIKRVLVVAPARVVYSVWRQEARLWEYTHKLRFSVLHGPEKNSKFNANTHIHLLNYEGMLWSAARLRKFVAVHKRWKYDMVIFDESSKIKDPKTRRWKDWKMLFKYFDYAVIATATPIPNTLMNIWAQWYVIDQGKALFTAYGRFQRTYFTNPKPFLWKPYKDSLDKVNALIAPQVIRVKRPPRAFDFNPIAVEFPEELQKVYDRLEDEFFLEFEGGEVEAFNAGSKSIKLRQFVQGAIYYFVENDERKVKYIHKVKLKALEELMDSYEGQPILCPIQFRFEVTMIQKYFKRKFSVIAGGTSPHESNLIINRWNEGKIKLLLCHPSSMSHGLNLQAGGNIVCWYGLTWSLEQYEQLIGRLNRRGQEKRVVVHALHMINTMDDVVMASLNNKAKTQNELLHQLHEYHKKRRGA